MNAGLKKYLEGRDPPSDQELKVALALIENRLPRTHKIIVEKIRWLEQCVKDKECVIQNLEGK